MALTLLSAACSPRAATLVPFPGTPTNQCVKEEVLPTITEVQPEKISPGGKAKVIAKGGYFRDNCGGYDESARDYDLYVDDNPTAKLSCYVNHCEAELTVPITMAAGPHCLGVQKGTCQMKFEVTGG